MGFSRFGVTTMLVSSLMALAGFRVFDLAQVTPAQQAADGTLVAVS